MKETEGKKKIKFRNSNMYNRKFYIDCVAQVSVTQIEV